MKSLGYLHLKSSSSAYAAPAIYNSWFVFSIQIMQKEYLY